MTKQALPSMIQNNSGRFINIASIYSLMYSPGESDYAGSKATLPINLSMIIKLDNLRWKLNGKLINKILIYYLILHMQKWL